jgi:hypothetical protein
MSYRKQASIIESLFVHRKSQSAAGVSQNVRLEDSAY